MIRVLLRNLVITKLATENSEALEEHRRQKMASLS